jgi:excinuclease UvrABC ATPase subunit
MDAETGHSLALPEPNTFSFNSPKGSCPNCKGLGTIKKINTDYFIDNPKLSINQGGFCHWKISNPTNGFCHRSKIFLRSLDWE